jgi:hypothetical protein
VLRLKTHYYDLFTRVLIYKEDDRFVAHALDFDLLGYGDTEDEAKEELQELVANQMMFSHGKNKPEMINFAAPKEFFDRWEEAAKQSGKATSEKSCALSTKSSIIAFTREEVRKLQQRNKGMFSKTEKLAVA